MVCGLGFRDPVSSHLFLRFYSNQDVDLRRCVRSQQVRWIPSQRQGQTLRTPRQVLWWDPLELCGSSFPEISPVYTEVGDRESAGVSWFNQAWSKTKKLMLLLNLFLMIVQESTLKSVLIYRPELLSKYILLHLDFICQNLFQRTSFLSRDVAACFLM